jgi:hypothetical protein
MLIELKTSSLKEILRICESNKWNIDEVDIENKIYTDLSTCEDYVKLYLKHTRKHNVTNIKVSGTMGALKI